MVSVLDSYYCGVAGLSLSRTDFYVDFIFFLLMDSVYRTIKVYFKSHSYLLYQILQKSVLYPASPGITLNDFHMYFILTFQRNVW